MRLFRLSYVFHESLNLSTVADATASITVNFELDTSIGTDRSHIDAIPATIRRDVFVFPTYWSRIANRRTGHISNFGYPMAWYPMADYNRRHSAERQNENKVGWLKSVISTNRSARIRGYWLLEDRVACMRWVNLFGWPNALVFTDLPSSNLSARQTLVGHRFITQTRKSLSTHFER